MFSKTAALVSLLAISARLVAAAPPACLLAAVNTQDDPSDLASICGSNASDVESQIQSLCHSNVDAAMSAFQDTCKSAGLTVSVSSSASSSATASKTASSSAEATASSSSPSNHYPTTFSTVTSTKSSLSTVIHPTGSGSVLPSAIITAPGSYSTPVGSGVASSTGYSWSSNGTVVGPSIVPNTSGTPITTGSPASYTNAAGRTESYGFAAIALAAGLGLVL